MPRGRPRKHANTNAAREARNNSSLQYWRRIRGNALAPPEFVAYAPQLSGEVPIATVEAIGLRVSPDTCVPNDPIEQAINELPDEPVQTRCPVIFEANEDAELARQIAQVRMDEAEQATEQAEYDASITREIEEGEIRERAIRDETHHADVLATPPDNQGTRHILDACVGDTDVARSISTSPTLRASTIRTPEVELPATAVTITATTPTLAGNYPSTPSQRSSTASSSIGRKRARQFPTQSNKLTAWLRPLPVHPTARSGNTPLPLEPSSLNPPPTPNPIHPSPIVSSPPTLPRSERDPTPRPIPAGAGAGAPTTVPTRSPSPDPTESTAYKLAKQLRVFQGCTHEQHAEAERQHQAHHERADVHSACSSLPQITSLLRGDYDGGTPLPLVINNEKLRQPASLPEGLDLAGAFEGTDAKAFPEDVGTPGEHMPRSLCLSRHHNSSARDRAPRTTFDIDSLCCFPSSLGFARQGINWYPKSHAFLNFEQDIHFSLPIRMFDKRGEETTRNVPLHKIPHYCFGTATGMDSLGIFILFPELHINSEHEHSNHLSNEDYELWYDAILMPAVTEVIGDANRLQHYPVSAKVARLDATTLASETFARKEVAREQLLKYVLQPQELDTLWTLALQRIADNPGCARFNNATLFAHSKNTKLEHMVDGLAPAYGRWERAWARVADPQFYSRDRTFVDIGKQVTSEDTALPYDANPEAREAEVYLWKRCCLEAHAATRIKLLPDGKRAKGSARVATYPWAMMRDTMGQTLFAVPQGQESMDGLVYSQFYALIKTPFDTSKAYVFHNEALENLALDPSYVRTLQQQGGGITFSRRVCELSYLHSKKRANANLVDNQWRSYGIREEHRVSLTLMDAVSEQWQQWDLYDDRIDHARPPRPYYIIPTQALLDFLSAQINKYCFLFEHTLAHTARSYSLPETMVMVMALRALRFCYGSNMLARESLLYKDRWEVQRGQGRVVREGLGTGETMERCGFGWFLPKMNWATLRFRAPHSENMLVGNLLVHREYKRRWRAVRDLRDVFMRFSQAEEWYTRLHIANRPRLRLFWLEYLHALNLEQFDADVWKAMLAAHKRQPELSPVAAQGHGPVSYCHRCMRDLFIVEGVVKPPHLITGNKTLYTTVDDVLDALFRWDDKRERQGWKDKPYRLILQRTFEMVQRRVGHATAREWLDQFFSLVRLTHWILPYPTSTTMLGYTKNSRSQGLVRRMMWFSAVFEPPEPVHGRRRARERDQPMPSAVYTRLRHARRDLQPTANPTDPWLKGTLLEASRAADLEQGDHWRLGRRHDGYSDWVPTWERGRAPVLGMQEEIRNKSLDELEEIMVAFTQVEESERASEERSAGRAPSIPLEPQGPVLRRPSIRTFFRDAERPILRAGASSHSSFRPSTHDS